MASLQGLDCNKMYFRPSQAQCSQSLTFQNTGICWGHFHKDQSPPGHCRKVKHVKHFWASNARTVVCAYVISQLHSLRDRITNVESRFQNSDNLLKVSKCEYSKGGFEPWSFHMSDPRLCPQTFVEPPCDFLHPHHTGLSSPCSCVWAPHDS